MIKIINLLTVIIIFVTFFTSCEKYEMDSDVSNTNYKNTNVENVDLSKFKQEFVFYIDNVQVENFDRYGDSLMIVERDIIDKKNKKIITQRYGFTTEKGYIDFGIENGYPLKEELEFRKLMRKYIEENKVEEYFENNRELPVEYVEFEKELYEKVFRKNNKIQGLLFGLILAKDEWGGGGHWTAFAKTWPVMLPGWNNAVSSYKPMGLAGIVSFYGKTFYRNHLFTKVQWAETWYNMSWYHCDNSLSSWFRF